MDMQVAQGLARLPVPQVRERVRLKDLAEALDDPEVLLRGGYVYDLLDHVMGADAGRSPDRSGSDPGRS